METGDRLGVAHCSRASGRLVSFSEISFHNGSIQASEANGAKHQRLE